VLAALAASLAAACTGAQPPASQAAATDLANLVQASRLLGPEAAACAADPPAGWDGDGLVLLADAAPAWAAALDPDGGSEPPGADGACDWDAFRRDLGRVKALSLRVAETADGPAPAAVARAVQVAEAIGLGTLDGAPPPELADLANSPPDVLSALALAEDQAGYLAEYLAARLEAGELRDTLTAAGQEHRARGDQLVAMAGEPDPRAAAYALGDSPGDEASARARWAAVELALASHYAQLPTDQPGTEPWVVWQLAQAHAWGADLPPLPFLD
jgi:hypothetical protein